MSYKTPRPLPTHHLRGPSLNPNATSNASSASGTAGASPALLARINEKKLELANLKELRDLSAQLATQMSMLEEKLGTLANGTEAVAVVLSNWHNVLRAINMASMKIPLPKDSDDAAAAAAEEQAASSLPLPQTLVRIPVQQMPLAGEHGAAGE